MTALPADEHELAQTWAALSIDVQALRQRDGTIVSERASDPGELPLPPLLAALAPGAPPQLALGDTLGEGGMGIVREATQTALQREVAVKMLRDGTASPTRAAQLLREGRVTGWLEHPNIVPVHAIGRDESGQPLFVMKRIEGTAWSEALEAVPDAERARGGYLQRHLRILQQVATAIDFAHSRGILHRDIKPDNVMIGSFGEVYVVDWGIAVRFAGDKPIGVPHVHDVCRIEGTPYFLAPEMVVGRGVDIGVHSDVYLLGATLHYVITGQPPREGDTLQAILLDAFRAEPHEYPDAVPRELIAIATRAMARDPSERYPSASDFAAAIEEFLTHRGSLELTDEASIRAEELDALAQVDDTEARVEALFHQARFAYEQALRAWPANELARAGLRGLLERMARYELRRGAPRAAQALLRSHGDAPPALAGDVDAALAALEAKEARLAELERDVDPTVGLVARQQSLVAGAIGWAATCVGCGALTRYDVLNVDHGRFAAAVGLSLFVSVVWGWARRDELSNAANRRVAFTTTTLFAAGVVLWPVLGSLGVSMPATTAIGSFVGGLVWTTVAFNGREWIPMAIGHFAVTAAVMVLPSLHFELYGLVGLPILITSYLTARYARAESTA